MRVGAVVAAFPALPLADYLALVRDVEARGYDTAWLGETAGGDAITLMTLIASQTQRINVASGVIPIQTRSPIILGMSASTLAHVAPGRISLGLGGSSVTVVWLVEVPGFCPDRVSSNGMLCSGRRGAYIPRSCADM